MPNISFLIGNGFDINIGLKTKFTDVKKEYLKLDSKDPRINNFKEVLKRDHENWSDFETAMGKYTEKFNRDNKEVYIFQIESFLEVLINKFEKEEARIDYTGNKDHIYLVFKESLTEFYNYLSEKSKLILRPFIRAINDTQEYIYNFIIFNYTNVLEKCLENIKSENGKLNLRTIPIHNISHQVKDKIGKILHVHGTLQENPILGVDNKEQILNSELADDKEFQWDIIKTKINEELEENYDIEAKNIISNSSIICIFGMSIGITDKTWWSNIFEWLKTEQNRHLVIFYYSDNKTKIPSMKIKHKYKIKDIFFDVVGIDDVHEREKYYKRIHIAKNNGNMFKFNLLSPKKEIVSCENKDIKTP